MNPKFDEVSRLKDIVHTYTIFFIILDIIIFVAMVALIAFAIMFLKSRRSLKSSNDYLRYTIKGQEAERARIARELHDTVAQDLRYCRSLSQKFTGEAGTQISRLLEKSLSSVRNMSYNLAPPDVLKNDLAANIMNLAQNFKEHTENIDFRLTMPENLYIAFLSEEENLNIYRIIQEALLNILKHAQATEVTILVRNENGSEPKGVYIFISDDGKGFDVPLQSMRGTDGKHFGLVGMKERAVLSDVKLEIDSHPGEGTQIMLAKTVTSQSYGGSKSK